MQGLRKLCRFFLVGRTHEHVRCPQAPVLLSLKAIYAKAAVPTAAKVLLVRFPTIKRPSHLRTFVHGVF